MTSLNRITFHCHNYVGLTKPPLVCYNISGGKNYEEKYF